MIKTFAILGDSYSTYEGWIPEDYEAWYSDNGNFKPNDITSHMQTWWWKLDRTGEFQLTINCSYSGSTVCTTGYDYHDADKTSFIRRMHRELGERSMSPDILLVFGGTNDCWAGSPVGKEKYAGWTEEDMKSFAPAFCYMMDYLKNTHPDTKIYNVVNDDIKGDVREQMLHICEKMKVECIILENIEKENGHPNQKGMQQIYEQIYSAIL